MREHAWFVELSCDDEETAEAELMVLCEQLEACGGDAEGAWVATTEAERAGQRFFRHAVPESVNMLIDQRRRTDPSITKLGSDMSVPDDRLRDVIAMYSSHARRRRFRECHVGPHWKQPRAM